MATQNFHQIFSLTVRTNKLFQAEIQFFYLPNLLHGGQSLLAGANKVPWLVKKFPTLD